MKLGCLVISLLLSSPAWAQPNKLARDIYKELVEINTVTNSGDTGQAADAMAVRLKAGGIPAADIQVFKPAPKKGNVVARLRGTGKKKPMIVMAHIDVVDAKREDWSIDPFTLTEKDGYFYGRGSGDDKFMATAFVANLIRYKQENFRPSRDIILVLETDEEIGDGNKLGIRWLIEHQRPLIDAEFAINEGAGVALKKGRPLRNGIQTAEKTYVDYRLEVTNRGGHSSVPLKDNAIYRLAAGLERLAKFEFPVKLNETTRLWFERSAAMEAPQVAADMRALAAGSADAAAIARLSADPIFNSQMRTTCVATMLQGGHAPNALPQLARANVNCRVLPGESIVELEITLAQVMADYEIKIIRAYEPTTSQPSPLKPEIMGPIEKLTAKFWPGIPVIPSMSSGATDGNFLRNAGIPVYGHSGLADDIDDVRAHGRDERVSMKAFDDSLEYLYQLVKTLAQ